MSRVMAGAMLAALLSACAGANKQTQQQVKSQNGTALAKDEKDPRIVCRMERPTGSNIPERVCRYVNLAESEDVARTQDMLRAAQGHAGPVKGN